MPCVYYTYKFKYAINLIIFCRPQGAIQIFNLSHKTHSMYRIHFTRFKSYLKNFYSTVSQKNINSQALALFRLAFATPTPNGLSLHAILTRWLIIQKVRHHRKTSSDSL